MFCIFEFYQYKYSTLNVSNDPRLYIYFMDIESIRAENLILAIFKVRKFLM